MLDLRPGADKGAFGEGRIRGRGVFGRGAGSAPDGRPHRCQPDLLRDQRRCEAGGLLAGQARPHPRVVEDPQEKGVDLLIQAEVGLAAVTGTPEGPGRVGISICDLATGQAAYAAVLEALLLRARTGRGAGVSVSLFATMAELMTVPFLHHLHGGAPRRVGLAHPSIAPYGVFPTKAEPVLISIQNEREWAVLCREVMELPDMAGDPRFAGNAARVAHRADLDTLIAARFLDIDADLLVERLKRAAIAFGRLNDLSGLERHPQLLRSGILTPEGPLDLPAPPVRWAGAPMAPSARSEVPRLDGHGAALRREFGSGDGDKERHRPGKA